MIEPAESRGHLKAEESGTVIGRYRLLEKIGVKRRCLGFSLSMLRWPLNFTT
jgi:hypothetical protein